MYEYKILCNGLCTIYLVQFLIYICYSITTFFYVYLQALLNIPSVSYQDAGFYICTANNSNVRMDIPRLLVVKGAVPFFSQAPNSYLSLPTLPNAYLFFEIEISFKPQRPDGKYNFYIMGLLFFLFIFILPYSFVNLIYHFAKLVFLKICIYFHLYCKQFILLAYV